MQSHHGNKESLETISMLELMKTYIINGEHDSRDKKRDVSVRCMYETQSSLTAAFPFGGHSLHERNITEPEPDTHNYLYRLNDIILEMEMENLYLQPFTNLL